MLDDAFDAASAVGVTEAEFLAVINSVRDIGDDSAIDVPVSETVLDSLDLAMIRSSIEVRIGAPISDEIWTGASTLRELLDALG